MQIPAQLIGELFEFLKSRDRAPAGLVLVKAMEDADLMAALWNGEPVWMMVPDVSPTDPAGTSTLLQLATAPSLKHLFGRETADAPGSAKEERIGLVRLVWVERLPGLAAVPTYPFQQPQAPLPPRQDSQGSLVPANWRLQRERTLDGLSSPDIRRAFLDPARRPYLHEIVHALAPLELDPAGVTFFRPSLDEVLAVERRFVEAVGDDLQRGQFQVVRKDRLFGFGELYATLQRYERQAVGWSCNGSRCVYLRFRLAGALETPLEDEYDVKDGGHAFFELQCQLPTLSLFNVVVNGEA